MSDFTTSTQYAASVNLLTLFALVLVIGTVVDNTIVVVEAVQARFDSGYTSSYEATVGTLALLFIVPSLFVILQTLQEKLSPIKEFVEPTDPMIIVQAEEIEKYTKKRG